MNDRSGGEQHEVQLVSHAAGVELAADRWVAPVPRGTVLLLHGGGQTRHSWHRTGDRLVAAGWTAVAFDTRGHGDSGWAPDGDYSMDALIADLRGMIADVATRPLVLAGASMGGLTSLLLQGERAVADALVLVDITPRIERAGVERITAFMRGGAVGFASLDEVLEAIRAYNPHRKRPPTRDGVRKNVRRGDDGRWYWHWDPAFLEGGDEPTRAATTERIRAAATEVGVPTLLVRGADSDIVSEEGVAELTRLIPHARAVDVAAAGHMVAGDDNDVFAEFLVEFLDTALPAG